MTVMNNQIVLRKSGSANVNTVRTHNESLVLRMIRKYGELTKADITKLTGLSPNASSVIFKHLESENLLVKGDKIKGRVGQPSCPYRINPDSRKSTALHIGRRSSELAAVNFVGEIIWSKKIYHQYPTPTIILNFLREEFPKLKAQIKDVEVPKLYIAMPFELWSWGDDFGASSQELQKWKNFDLKAHIRNLGDFTHILIENDGTSACRAEYIFAPFSPENDWIYFYIGTFIGGGIVLDGNVYTGTRGNAGGFGPMRVPNQEGGNRLVDHASLIILERMLEKSGIDPLCIHDKDFNWDQIETITKEWTRRVGENLAYAILSSLSLLDFEKVVIEGAFPEKVKALIVEEVETQLNSGDLQGVHIPTISPGFVGRAARAKGAIALDL